MSQRFEAILAIDSNNGLAKNGVIPWKNKTDLQFFKNKTINNIVIMGSKTLLSLPNSQPLKGRQNIVITNQVDKFSKFYSNYTCDEIIFLNVEQTLDIIQNNKESKFYVIGGNQIYNLLLPYCNKIWVTKLKQNYSCDIFFDYDLSFYKKEVIYEDNDLEIICFKD